MAQTINIKNKKAFYQYFILDRFTAGIVLTGTEIKSIRGGKANLSDAYCQFREGELFVFGLHISEYTFGTYNNHDPKRPRKLLLNRRELKKIFTNIHEKGLTIIPLYLFINEKGLAKIEISIAKGKKLYDKRETLKAKDTKREIERGRY
ncbi:MAG: SsrA-binding protein SmpB [Bacteroidia bacterium]|jgi:SsrA-binding protein|nr:SsrA-binding protein SmpB [Bacteroidales bacterium]NCD40925.1 SsrA-binding protein SmpB [Bacteroidia bacterium]MDD2323518.1 SsrA-binding protein SmpB [Bacteroidales bacterium]MDD3010845.1 SsrA-binding protein SmpB [Bacteroidales bacterium]MDD3960446.1 SsrA-binding protein SmpB [Bacteroidales bacterium]